MQRIRAAMFVLSLASTASAERFWISYEADVLPEQAGWTHVRTTPGGDRWVEGGTFGLYTLYRPSVYDFNFRQATATLAPGEELALEWRMRVTDGWIHDTFVMIGQGAAFGGVGVSIGMNRVEISESLSVPISILDFHTYRMATSDMRNFTLSIDGVYVHTLTTSTTYSPNINVLFGDWTGGGDVSSFSEWDYVRFGVVPAPSAAGAVLAAGLAFTRRRRA